MVSAATWIFFGLCGTLFVTIALRMLNGEIVTSGLVAGDTSRILQPERLQAALIAIGLPIAYAAMVIDEAARIGPLTRLIDPPEWMLVAAAGSQSLYIAGKIARQNLSGS